MESTEPPVRLANASDEGSEQDHYFIDYRAEDRDRFAALIGSEHVELDLDRWKTPGRYTTTAVYEYYRQRKPKPVDWPGLWLDQIADRCRGDLAEWMFSQGIEPA